MKKVSFVCVQLMKLNENARYVFSLWILFLLNESCWYYFLWISFLTKCVLCMFLLQCFPKIRHFHIICDNFLPLLVAPYKFNGAHFSLSCEGVSGSNWRWLDHASLGPPLNPKVETASPLRWKIHQKSLNVITVWGWEEMKACTTFNFC